MIIVARAVGWTAHGPLPRFLRSALQFAVHGSSSPGLQGHGLRNSGSSGSGSRWAIYVSGLLWLGLGLGGWLGSAVWAIQEPPQAGAGPVAGGPAAAGVNSTKKIRVQPSKIAGRIGTAVQWRPSLEAACEESQRTGRPVFWYIHTVPGTFTDRKIELDRYLMAGPFSWPKIIDRLNQHFVPLRVAPDAAAAARFGLEPYRFVEPGFIVLAPDPAGRGVEGQGAEGRFELLRRVDQVTTLHPDWLLHLIRQCGAGPAVAVEAAGLESIWTLPEASAALVAFRRFMSDPWRREIDLSVFAGSAEEPGHRLETMLMMGMIQYYLGDHAAARETWGKVIEADPEHPLAWKAAAEREGFGPFVRGFEVHGPLPRSVWQAGIASEGSAAPAGAYSETELWERSTKFLLAMQRGDGALMDSDYDFGGTDSLPNVYVAVTALAGLSLMEAENRLPALAAEIRGAIERAADFVRDEGNLNPTDRDEILWAYAYRLRFLVARYRLGQESLATVNAAIQRLESVQGRRGSWYHEYSNSFVTATALVALADAHQAGGTVNQDIVDRGVQSLKRDRYANGAFPYSNGRNAGDNAGVEGDLVASAGRMPICELALLLWGHSDQDRLRFAVQTSLQHHDKLALGYKYDNHTSTLAYGGFFFWYDMRSRAEAIRHLQSGDEVDGIQAQAADQHRRLIAQLPELDGCFVDSHELGRCYGSAMALLSMSTLDLVEPVRDAK